VVGKTEDGKPVIGNLFVLCESRGMPLEIAIDVLNDNNCVVSWIDFYEDAMDSLWSPETTLEKIKSALNETIGREHSEDVILRLKYYMASKHK
jgi:hypothetical protein